MGNAGSALTPALADAAGHTPTAAFAIARYSKDGVLDSSFGPNGNGKVISNFAGNEWAYSGALTSADEIVMAGQRAGEGILAKFNKNGIPDVGFGTLGHGIVQRITTCYRLSSGKNFI